MVEAWQQRDYERQVLLEDIMEDVYQNLDDQKMLEVAADLLHYIRISVMQKRDLRSSLCKETSGYLSMIEEFSRTPEEKNVMINMLREKLESSGTMFLHTALNMQQITKPKMIYDLELLAQED